VRTLLVTCHTNRIAVQADFPLIHEVADDDAAANIYNVLYDPAASSDT
jgi:hypothetical protein